MKSKKVASKNWDSEAFLLSTVESSDICSKLNMTRLLASIFSFFSSAFTYWVTLADFPWEFTVLVYSIYTFELFLDVD